MSLCVPASVREKEESIKTVEDLLEKGLIEMANKDEQLKVCVSHISLTSDPSPLVTVNLPVCLVITISDREIKKKKKSLFPDFTDCNK